MVEELLLCIRIIPSLGNLICKKNKCNNLWKHTTTIDNFVKLDVFKVNYWLNYKLISWSQLPYFLKFRPWCIVIDWLSKMDV